MPMNHIDFLSSKLAGKMLSTHHVMKLSNYRGALDQLNALPEGDHVYLIVSYSGRREVVKYTHSGKIVPNGDSFLIPVERGQHGTTITTWAVGCCVRTELTKHVLDEWGRENCCKDTP